jgi:intron-binding protein aquarius
MQIPSLDKNTEVLDVEHAFHIVVRRDPKANNFKAVLETIRTLMNNSQEAIIPPWLHQLFLGYGDPEKSQYRQVGQLSEVDFRDTFLDREHVFESFAGAGARKVEVRMKD